MLGTSGQSTLSDRLILQETKPPHRGENSPSCILLTWYGLSDIGREHTAAIMGDEQ